MMKLTLISLVTMLTFFMTGCNSVDGDLNSTNSGVSGEGSNSGFESLSGTEDIKGYLEEAQWTSITLDLDKFIYDSDGTTKTYALEMDFVDGEVSVLADCYLISAHYRLSDDEIRFTRVSSPKPAIDSPTCKEVKDAENAVSAFLSYSYFIKADAQKEALFEATDIDTSVTLNR